MRRLILDVEANGLKPTEIHCVVTRDEDDTVTVFRSFHEPGRIHELLTHLTAVPTTYVGHNILCYDAPALLAVLGIDLPEANCIDTLVLSRLIDEDIPGGHSLEAWGQRLGEKKEGSGITDWSVWTQEMEARCISDTKINLLLLKRFDKYLLSPRWLPSITTEHFIQARCRTLHENGFAFDLPGAVKLRDVIDKELSDLDEALGKAFPPRTKFLREYTPKATKFGTISKSSVPRGDVDLSEYTIGAPFSRIEFVPFNAGSPPQIVERLNEAGWRPTEKTKGHREAIKEHQQLLRKRKRSFFDNLRLKELGEKLEKYTKTGWSISEENLQTLPDSAPAAAHTLARRLLLASRSSTLTSWITACGEDGRIHGSFAGIGAWTHRMSHSNPNQGNIPKFDAKQPHKTPYSDRMRSLWTSGPNRLLVGVDAESIQLRIFAHYIDDKEFTESLLSGDKSLGTDPHSVNQRALGPICKSRDDSKTFIYAFLLGCGDEKASQILTCTRPEAHDAKERFIKRYPGLEYLKKEVIPADAARGYFEGFDGRYVKIFGEDQGQKEHFALAGYLQNGETVIMKKSAEIWYPKLKREGVPFWFVNFVHDEFQVETEEELEVALYVGRTIADAIAEVGYNLKLRCPMAGSVLGEHGLEIDGKRYAIGKNWYVTH